jgi:hypothetical protein
MAEGAEGVAAELIGRLERAWNEADGRAFGEPFAPTPTSSPSEASTFTAEKRSRPGTRPSSIRSTRAAAPTSS